MPSILAVSEPVAAKRSLAHKLGADLVIGPATERIEELILMYSDGQGFDAVIAKNSTSHFSRSVPVRRRTSMLFVPAAFFALFPKNVLLILVILALAFL